MIKRKLHSFGFDTYQSSTDRRLDSWPFAAVQGPRTVQGPWVAANRTHYKDAYRDSTYEQIGALSGFIVPLIYLKQKKYAELHRWSTAVLGGLLGFSAAAHIGITVSSYHKVTVNDCIKNNVFRKTNSKQLNLEISDFLTVPLEELL